jgi:hypothetical protein
VTFPLFVSLLFWAGLLAAGIALAARRPAGAVRVAKVLLAALVVVWVMACATGIAIQARRRGGVGEELWRRTPFDGPHAVLSHIAVVLVAIAFCFCVPLAVARAVRRDGTARLVLHLLFAGATAMLILLSSFSGHLGRPPRTDGSILRFVILHFMAFPFLGTLTLLGWWLVVRRYARPSTLTDA